MSKAEQIFKTADFSVETDLKERLRKQLFENREIELSEKGLRDNGDNDGSQVVGKDVGNVGSLVLMSSIWSTLPAISQCSRIPPAGENPARPKTAKAKIPGTILFPEIFLIMTKNN